MGAHRPSYRSVRSGCAPGLLPRHTCRSGGPRQAQREASAALPLGSQQLRSRSPPTSHPPVRWPGQAQRVLPAALPLGSRRLCFRISPTSHLPALPARAGVSGATGRLTARFAAAVFPDISHVTPAGVAGPGGRIGCYRPSYRSVRSGCAPGLLPRHTRRRCRPAKKRCFSFADVIYIILMENQTWRCDEKESTGFDSPGREWRPPAVSRQRVQTGKFTLEHLG